MSSIVAMTAALARPRPMDAASSPAVVPCSTLRSEPSGSVIVISGIRRCYGVPCWVPEPVFRVEPPNKRGLEQHAQQRGGFGDALAARSGVVDGGDRTRG